MGEQRLNVAVAAAEVALDEAESQKQAHLERVVGKKLVVIAVDDIRELVEASWLELQRRGYVRI